MELIKRNVNFYSFEEWPQDSIVQGKHMNIEKVEQQSFMSDIIWQDQSIDSVWGALKVTEENLHHIFLLELFAFI